MKSRLITLATFCLASVMGLGGACSRPDKTVAKQLVGRWQEEPDTGAIEFFDDGRLALFTSGLTLAGNWTVLPDGRVKIEVSMFGATDIGTGRIQGKILRFAFVGSRDSIMWRRQGS